MGVACCGRDMGRRWDVDGCRCDAVGAAGCGRGIVGGVAGCGRGIVGGGVSSNLFLLVLKLDGKVLNSRSSKSLKHLQLNKTTLNAKKLQQATCFL